MMGLLMIGALGIALVLATSIETIISRNHRDGAGAFYAADAAAGRAVRELSAIDDWTSVLNGSMRSALLDGEPGPRTLADGSMVDLSEVINLANCGQIGECTDAEMAAVTAPRPWGLNNPRWRVFASGSLAGLLGVPSRYYVAVLVADDPAETDGDPLADGAGAGNPGSGVLAIRAEAFGPGGAHSAIDVTAARAGLMSSSPIRVVSWRAER
jgi:hypothetical protein